MNMVQPKKRLYRNDVSAETREKQSIAHQGRKHSNVLNLLGMSDFRLAMFLDSVDRLIYFRNKKTREKISLVELASGI